MANTIILKRSATPGKVPTTSQLALGEIAINTYDGLIYIKKDDGTPSVVQIGGVTSVAGKTGAVTLNTDDLSDSGRTNKFFSTSLSRQSFSAGTGISYNSGTGVISTSQNISSTSSPTFAGLTINGNISTTGDIIPTADITYDLGSPTRQWKDIYVGPGSLYVNGSKVLQDDSGTIAFTADVDQNIRIKTLGNGILQLGSSSTILQVDSTLQITSGKNITDSSGVQVNFGDNIQMNNNKVVGLGAPSASSDAATKGYVDTQVSAISTSSIQQGNSNVTVTDSGTGTVTVTVDGTTALTVDANGVTVAGNFTVSGTQTTVNSNTINLADNIITLNSDHTGAPTQNAGLLVERGDEADAQIRWNEGTDKWTFTNDGATYWPMAVNTDDLAEGSTNQYHTTARARGAISASSSTGVSYNSTTGAISLGSIPNSSLANNSITINGTAVSLGGTRTLDSDAISEGSTNLYFTNARARGAVSAGTGISYNSTTGAISTSAIPNASLANSAVTVGTTSISLGGSATTLAGLTSVTSTGFTGALTGNADTATSAGKWTTARTITLGGDLTGSASIDGSANVTLTATVAANSVALGTDTTGNYMVDLTAGTGITVTHTAGEGSNATVAVDTSTIATRSYVDSAVAGKDNTDEITEGTTNLYFTNARARGAVSAGGSLSYNSTTGVFSYTTPSTSGISEGSNLYFTDARARAAISASGDLSYSSATGVISFTQNKAWSAITGTPTTVAGYGITNAYTKTEVDSAISNAVAGKDNTDEITEGVTNQYFTTARARGAVSAGTGISYNSSTGVITNSDLGSSQNIFKNFTDGTTTAAADSNNDTFKFRGSAGVTVAVASDDATHGDSLLISLSSVPNSSLANNSITINGTAVALGGTRTLSTTDIGEGTNLYYTDARARAAHSVTGGSAAYNSTTGVITVPTTSAHITESGNLFYTDARARAAVSFTAGSGAYNSTTGVFTIPTNTNQLTNGAGYVTSSGVTSVATGNGLTGGTITSTGTLSLSGSYTGTWAVTGGITATGEVTAYFSDANLKKDIVEITDPIAKLMSIRGVTFRPNETALALGITDKEEVGVIAQEVEAVLPQLVTPSAFAGYKTVKYDKLTALLVEAVKAQQLQIDALRAEIAKLGGSAKTEL